MFHASNINFAIRLDWILFSKNLSRRMRSYEERGEETLRPLVTKILIMYSLGERKKRVILENVCSNKGGFERSKIKGEKGYIFLYS